MDDEQQPLNEQHKNRHTTTYAIAAIIALIIIGVIVVSTKSSNKPESTASTTSTLAANSNKSYMDGDYTATGSYQSPGGNEKITVNITLKNGIITDSSAQSGATDSEGRQYQAIFIKNYKQQVVGKKISGLSLNRVSGSSLTPQGFNDAIEQIQRQAAV